MNRGRSGKFFLVFLKIIYRFRRHSSKKHREPRVNPIQQNFMDENFCPMNRKNLYYICAYRSLFLTYLNTHIYGAWFFPKKNSSVKYCCIGLTRGSRHFLYLCN